MDFAETATKLETLIHVRERAAVEEAFTRLDPKINTDHEMDYEEILNAMFPQP